MSQTIPSMLIAGLAYPRLTSCLGLGWLACRTAYMVGYVYSGQAKGMGRRWGGMWYLFHFGLWALCLKMGWDLL